MFDVIGYIAYWKQKEALAGLSARTSGTKLQLTTVSPSWYALTYDGKIIKQESTVDDSAAAVAAMKASGCKVMPVLANYINKKWQKDPVSKMLASTVYRTALVNNLVTMAVARGFDGWDIDFEHGVAADRDRYVLFAGQLGSALQSAGKKLSITVHPKQSEPGPQPKNQAQDYSGLSANADQFRIMLYDYHWETSEPGAVAPMPWVKAVATFAKSRVAASKLVLGFATYGYLWPNSGVGESLMYDTLAATAKSNNATIKLNTQTSGENAGGAYFGYSGHTSWLENAASLAPKIQLAKSIGLAGVHFWRLGGDDRSIWS